MKQKFLFSYCQGEIDESTLFVDVYIGAGRQDQRDRQFFEALAEKCSSYYFSLYDIAVTRFVESVDIFLKEQTNDERVRVLRCAMSAAKLRRLLRSGMYEEWARIFFAATRGLRRMALSDNSAYFCAVNRADKTPAMPQKL